MNGYTVLAKYYDKLNYDCDYEKWSQYLYSLLEKYSAVKGEGADAACGSGKMTISLCKKGLEIFGFDISPDMLSAAKENAASEALGIEFICADMEKFRAHRKLRFITCACDGINYVERNSIGKCLKNLYNNLLPGGVLLFDISSAYKHENVIGNNVFSDDTGEVTYIWNNTLEKDRGRVLMDLIFFVREGKKYLRFDENHIQYIYEADFLEDELYRAGFKAVEVYDFLKTEPPAANSQRIQFAALK